MHNTEEFIAKYKLTMTCTAVSNKEKDGWYIELATEKKAVVLHSRYFAENLVHYLRDLRTEFFMVTDEAHHNYSEREKIQAWAEDEGLSFREATKEYQSAAKRVAQMQTFFTAKMHKDFMTYIEL